MSFLIKYDDVIKSQKDDLEAKIASLKAPVSLNLY